ncbi:molecular chaperone TorD family protein [Nannocystaceae bacterium ST9]
MSPSPSAASQAHTRARSRAYALLTKLLLEGLDADTLALVRALPGWLIDEGDVVELDAIAAEQHAVLQLGVFPYGGVFLDPSAVAGASADLAFEFYARAGFRPRLDEVAGDHLGVMVAFLAYACPHPRFDPIVADFLDACVLSWLPALVVAADSLEARFWPRVLHATLELAAEHRLALPHPRRAPLLAPVDDPLADERTGLRQIAEFLLTPVASGVFLGREDITRLGRRHDLPRGFGARVIMLDNLLRSAVEHGRSPSLWQSIDELLLGRLAAMEGVAMELELEIDRWRERIERSRDLVGRVLVATR